MDHEISIVLFEIYTVGAIIQGAKGIPKEPQVKSYYCEICAVQNCTLWGLPVIERNINTDGKQFYCFFQKRLHDSSKNILSSIKCPFIANYLQIILKTLYTT